MKMWQLEDLTKERLKVYLKRAEIEYKDNPSSDNRDKVIRAKRALLAKDQVALHVSDMYTDLQDFRFVRDKGIMGVKL